MAPLPDYCHIIFTSWYLISDNDLKMNQQWIDDCRVQFEYINLCHGTIARSLSVHVYIKNVTIFSIISRKMYIFSWQLHHLKFSPMSLHRSELHSHPVYWLHQSQPNWIRIMVNISLLHICNCHKSRAVNLVPT